MKETSKGRIRQQGMLTAKEVAIYLGLSTKTVYKYLSENKLPSIRIGRAHYISSEDVVEFRKNNMKI